MGVVWNLQVLIEVPVCVGARSYVRNDHILHAQLRMDGHQILVLLYVQTTGLVTFTFYGMIMVSITPNLMLATVVSAFFYTIFNLYSGFLIPRPVSNYTTLHSQKQLSHEFSPTNLVEL